MRLQDSQAKQCVGRHMLFWLDSILCLEGYFLVGRLKSMQILLFWYSCFFKQQTRFPCGLSNSQSACETFPTKWNYKYIFMWPVLQKGTCTVIGAFCVLSFVWAHISCLSAAFLFRMFCTSVTVSWLNRKLIRRRRIMKLGCEEGLSSLLLKLQ